PCANASEASTSTSCSTMGLLIPGGLLCRTDEMPRCSTTLVGPPIERGGHADGRAHWDVAYARHPIPLNAPWHDGHSKAGTNKRRHHMPGLRHLTDRGFESAGPT